MVAFERCDPGLDLANEETSDASSSGTRERPLAWPLPCDHDLFRRACGDDFLIWSISAVGCNQRGGSGW